MLSTIGVISRSEKKARRDKEGDVRDRGKKERARYRNNRKNSGEIVLL